MFHNTLADAIYQANKETLTEKVHLSVREITAKTRLMAENPRKQYTYCYYGVYLGAYEDAIYVTLLIG